MSKVHFIMDEAAMIGHLDSMDDALRLGRAYGIHMHFFYQGLGQLKKCWPNGEDGTLLANTSQIYFGVNDNATAEMISNRLGEGTIVVQSGGSSSGMSDQFSNGQHPNNSKGHSRNANSNWNLQARKLAKPEEVMALPPRTAIVFTPGMRPICTTLIRYYEEKDLRRRGWFRRWWAACNTLVTSAVLCATALGMAGVLTLALQKAQKPKPAAPITPQNYQFKLFSTK